MLPATWSDGDARSQATIVGTVTSEGGSPLAYATVSLPRLNLSSMTDASGNYRLSVAADPAAAGSAGSTRG